ncbi:MAG: YihY/virulence factor BrkB family protein [Bacteroidales bacterium]|nr:YihY/virulence factor BrkB family protein [Bacteroidales bacterium]
MISLLNPNKKDNFLNKWILRITGRAKKLVLPGFERVPFYDVVIFFFRGIQNGALTTRASAIAFHFFLALLPAIIYFFTIIPFIPVDNFQEGLLNLIEDILPGNVYELIQNTIQDMLIKRRGLSYFGLFIALIFSTNGINAMIVAFNNTYHTIETRTWYERRLIAVLLVIIIFSLITLSVSLITFSRFTVNTLVEMELMRKGLTFYILLTGKWIIVILSIFTAISFLYLLGPSRRMKWKFRTPGSTLASLLVILTSLVFSYIINHFGQFNKFFGTIGTIMVILIWLYLNSLVLLIGFELNASIKNARIEFDRINDKEI